jgi:hypothetical protein
MNRPFPLPSDIEIKQLRPATYLTRAATASLRSFITGAPAVSVAKATWDDDRVTPLILRAASGPARTDTANWAQQLAQIAIFDLIQSITSLSAAAEIISRGVQINTDRVAEVLVPGRTVFASGAWVSEGSPIPVRSLSFANAATLYPRRLVVLTTYTREMAESSNLENIVRASLGEQLAIDLDTKLFSSDAATSSAPAGLFSGVPPIVPTSGGGATPVRPPSPTWATCSRRSPPIRRARPQ